mgnify:CR=1 FL=1|jgi:hypothetical protein
MKLLLSKPFNLVAFNLMWLGCVLGREQLLWLVAPLVLAYLTLLVANGILLMQQLFLPAAIGITVDLVLTLLGFFAFDTSAVLLPAWLIVLWLAFSSTLNLSLSVFQSKISLAVVAGAVAFPVNYAVGQRLGAVEFPQSDSITLLILALIWAALLPLLFRVSQRRFAQTLQAGS